MKRFTPKVVVIVASLLLLLVTVSVSVWFFFLKGPDPDKFSGESFEVEASDKTVVEAAEPQFKDVVDVEPFEAIKLKPGGNISSVTLEVSLELVSPDMRQNVEAGMESIRRIIETTVAETTWLELRSTEGKLGLKLELIKRINHSLSVDTPASQNPAVQSQNIAGARIRDLFFINLIMQ